MPPSIFQQIVLPYLSHRSLASPARFARFLSYSIARERAAADADSSPSSSTALSHGPSKRWDYVPPISPIPYEAGHDPPLQPSRTRHRARMSLPSAVQATTSSSSSSIGGTAAEVLAFLRSLEESKGGRQATLLMALEKIASIPDHLVEREAAEEERLARREPEEADPSSKLERRKGRIRAKATDTSAQEQAADSIKSASTSAQMLTPRLPALTSTSLAVPTVPVGETTSIKLTEHLRTSHFPPIIFTLLRTRLYRLTVYHLLLTPEYAVDQPLLDRVADYMRLDGAGKLARRLEKGWDGTHDGNAPLPHLPPFGSHLRRHPDAWLLSRRAAARPIPNEPTLAALTANYNSHLTRALLSPKKGSSSSSTQSHSSNPLTPLNNMLTSSHPLAKPSGGMRQLRQLLHKIDRLERHRSFRPDWVTANLVVKCWMSCLMAGGSGWKAGAAGSGGGAEMQGVEIDKRGELRGLFGFVRALFEKGLDEQVAWEKSEAQSAAEGGRDSPAPSLPSTGTLSSPPQPTTMPPQNPSQAIASFRIHPPRPYTYPQALSYTRHVRPFANDLLRAFREIGDRYAIGRVIEWQREMKDRMEGDHALLRGGQPKRIEFGKRRASKG